MMKLLAILLIPIGLIAGLAGGHFLAPKAEEDTSAEGDNIAVVQEIPKSTPIDLSETDYANLDKHFIVPVIENGSVSSLVVITMAVEVTRENREIVFEHEPKLRAEFLNVLFNHAQSGGFSGVFIQTQIMSDLRASLNAAAWNILGEIAQQVLITSLTRQDV